MRPHAALLLTTAVLLAACGTDGVAPPAADTVTASPSASEAPSPDTARSERSTPPSPSAEPTPSTPPSSPTSPPPTEAEPEPAAPPAADVAIVDFDYAPDPVEVTVGGTVTWTNQDSTAHTATVSGGPDTGAIAAGSSGSITFTTPGTYDYVCQFHPGSMAGTVVVRGQ